MMTHCIYTLNRILLLMISLLVLVPNMTLATETKKKVAVIEFDSKGNFDIPYAGSIVAEWMISELGKLETFTLVERVLLKKVIAEQQLTASGLVDEEKSSAKLGEIFGVDAIVTGGVLKWQQSITITARLIDTSSGSILRTSSVEARSINQVPQLIRKLAMELSGKKASTPLSPRPATKMSFASPLRMTVDPNTPPPVPTQKTNRQWLEDVTGIHFVWIEPGCFVMGQSRPPLKTITGAKNTPLYYQDENPPHRVCLDGFWMATTETSNEQFRRLQPGHNSGSHKSRDLNLDQQPAVMVSWQEARSFAAILSEQYANKGATFRLPSEAEWEYAARAGSNTNLPWPEDEICRRVNGYDKSAVALKQDVTPLPCNDGNVASAAVGSYVANAFGLFDMTGNVWEWVEDVYNPDAYLNHDQQNPLYLGVGGSRVNRGGSWLDGIEQLRSSCRGHQAPDQSSSHIGFRLVMERK